MFTSPNVFTKTRKKKKSFTRIAYSPKIGFHDEMYFFYQLIRFHQETHFINNKKHVFTITTEI